MDERDTFVRGTLAGAALVGALGGGILVLLGRAGWALGFGMGAAISLGNFHLIVRAVSRLTEPGVTQPAGHFWKGAVVRFAVVGAVLVLALVVLRVSLLALLAGLILTHATMIGYWLVRSLRAHA